MGQGEDVGRGRLMRSSVALRYAFKTPSLREVTRRAPYMHDGSVPTLEAVLDLYEGMPHVFQGSVPDTPETLTAIGRAAAFFGDHLRSR